MYREPGCYQSPGLPHPRAGDVIGLDRRQRREVEQWGLQPKPHVAWQVQVQVCGAAPQQGSAWEGRERPCFLLAPRHRRSKQLQSSPMVPLKELLACLCLCLL